MKSYLFAFCYLSLQKTSCSIGHFFISGKLLVAFTSLILKVSWDTLEFNPKVPLLHIQQMLYIVAWKKTHPKTVEKLQEGGRPSNTLKKKK